MRWFWLLEMSDLLLDVYTSYLALYLAEVVGLSKAQVGLALGGLIGISLAADLALIPLLEHVKGLKVCLVGWTAARTGLPTAMWLLWMGPVALVAFIPKKELDGHVSDPTV